MNVVATMMTTLMEPLPKRSLITTRCMNLIGITTGTGISKKIIKCQRDIGAYAKIALCNYQLLKSLSMELTNLILNGMMKKWAGLCHLNKCPLSVAILFKISYIKIVESRDSEEGEAGRPKGSPPIVATYSHS